MRNLGRPDAVPVVELGAEKMPTRWGMKSKPAFKIVKWFGGSNGNDGNGPKEIAPPSLKEGKRPANHASYLSFAPEKLAR